MIIERPNIKTDRYWMNDYRNLWDNFIADYNEGKSLGKQLRPRHGDLFKVLVIQASSEMKDNNKTLQDTPENIIHDSTKWLPISGSVHLMAKKLSGVCANTVRNLYDRMEEAGIIKRNNEDFIKLIGRNKINRFTRKEVLINPDFLLIYDLYNPEYVPTSPWLQATEKRGFRKEKVKNLIGVSSVSTLPDSLSNEIMPVDTVEKGVSHPVDNLLNENRIQTSPDATPNLNGLKTQNNTQTQKKCLKTPKTEEKPHTTDQKQEVPRENDGKFQKIEGVPAEKLPTKRDNMAWLRTKLAVELYAFMLKMLFKTHNIYQGEATKAMHYLEEYYFEGVNDEQQGAYLMKIYKWRVSKAASYNFNHKRDFSNTYPCHYLDVSNPTGFIGTEIWYEKDQRDKARKARAKAYNMQRLQEKESLQKAIEAYLENPNPSQFKRTTDWFNANIPHLCNDFINAVIN